MPWYLTVARIGMLGFRVQLTEFGRLEIDETSSACPLSPLDNYGVSILPVQTDNDRQFRVHPDTRFQISQWVWYQHHQRNAENETLSELYWASYPRHLRSNMVHQIFSSFPNSHQKLHYETRHSLLCKCEQLINHSIFPVTGKHDDNHLEEPTGPRTTGNLEIPSLQASALQALPQNTSWNL